MPYFGKEPNTSATSKIGTGATEDTKLVFDGNVLDFRIGIDDGTDKLEIGKGNAHGTTAHMIMDSYMQQNGSLIIAMDAGDTAIARTTVSGGTAQADIDAGESFFSGHLIG